MSTHAEVFAALSAPKDATDPLSTLSKSDLRKLRAQIENLLGEVKSLGEMDMPTELIEQYNKVKGLQEEVLHDDETPANQKASVAGQVASTLQQLIKMQTEFYTSERFRLIENLMIKFLKSVPLEKAEEFLKEYEQLGVENV